MGPFPISGGGGAVFIADSPAAAMRKRWAAVERLAAAASCFLAALLPRIDRKVIDAVAAAWLEVYIGSAEDRARAIQAYESVPSHPAALAAPDWNTERLISLTREREQLAEQIAVGEQGLDSLPEKGDAYGKIVESTMLMPMRNRLEAIETEISQLQAQMEKTNPLTG